MLVHPGEVVRRHGEQGVASPDAPLLVVFGDEGLDVPAEQVVVYILHQPGDIISDEADGVQGNRG